MVQRISFMNLILFKMNWIKCEDQLPKVNELVIVASEKPNWEITVAEYTFQDEWRVLMSLGTIGGTDYFPVKEFSHWMSLPEKPTE